MHAIRWALYFERLAPILGHAREIQAAGVDKHSPDLPKAISRFNAANELVPELEALMYP